MHSLPCTCSQSLPVTAIHSHALAPSHTHSLTLIHSPPSTLTHLSLPLLEQAMATLAPTPTPPPTPPPCCTSTNSRRRHVSTSARLHLCLRVGLRLRLLGKLEKLPSTDEPTAIGIKHLQHLETQTYRETYNGSLTLTQWVGSWDSLTQWLAHGLTHLGEVVC